MIFEVWVYLKRANTFSGRSGWHKTGSHATRAEAEEFASIGRRANRDLTYVVRAVEHPTRTVNGYAE